MAIRLAALDYDLSMDRYGAYPHTSQVARSFPRAYNAWEVLVGRNWQIVDARDCSMLALGGSVFP